MDRGARAHLARVATRVAWALVGAADLGEGIVEVAADHRRVLVGRAHAGRLRLLVALVAGTVLLDPESRSGFIRVIARMTTFPCILYLRLQVQ